MKKKGMVILSVLFLVSLALSSCTLGSINISVGPTATPTLTPTPVPVPGVDIPIVVNELSLLFYEVETQKSVKFGGLTVNTKAPYDVWIGVKASIEYSEANDPCNWKGDDKVLLNYVKNGNSEEKEWTMCQTDRSDGWVMFLFATYTSGVSNYEVVLPGGIKIPLDGFIDITTGTTL